MSPRSFSEELCLSWKSRKEGSRCSNPKIEHSHIQFIILRGPADLPQNNQPSFGERARSEQRRNGLLWGVKSQPQKDGEDQMCGVRADQAT
jgi:hypothetical protein